MINFFSFHITPILMANVPQYFYSTKTGSVFLRLKASFL